MNKQSPSNNPIQWFFNACLLLLFGTVALSVAVHLLQAIWWWVLGFLVLVAVVVIGVAAWRFWRRPW